MKETILPIEQAEDERIERILSLFEHKKRIIRKDVDISLGVSQSTASILLRKMIEKGLLTKVGDGRSSKYQRVEKE